MLPLHRLASLRRRKPFAMTGPPMPSRMPKEWKPNLKPMARNNSTCRRAISHERCFRHLVEMVASRLHCLVPHTLLMLCVQYDTFFGQIKYHGALNDIENILAHAYVRGDVFHRSKYALLTYIFMH